MIEFANISKTNIGYKLFIKILSTAVIILYFIFLSTDIGTISIYYNHSTTSILYDVDYQVLLITFMFTNRAHKIFLYGL